jgi:type IV secretory pathway VirB10-like protein
MSRKNKAQSLREAKDKRMKRVAIGGAVVFVAVLAFEVPKVLHQGGGGSSAAPATTIAASTDATTTTPAIAPATTPPGAAAAAVTPTASMKLPDSEAGPKGAKSQLYSFTHFSDKNPFVQQVAASSATGSAASSSSTSSGTAAGSTSGSTITSSAGGPNTTPKEQSRMLAGAGTARISINGKIQTVRVGASFPSANPLFRLVSLAHGVARIGIASGSYASGAQTLSLATGRSVTLADTADGVRYKLRLISGS